MFETESIIRFFDAAWQQFIELSTSPQVYSQLGFIVLAVITALSVTAILKKYAPVIRTEPETGPLLAFRWRIYNLRDLLFPLLNILALSIAVELSSLLIHKSWLIRLAEGLAVIFLLYNIISRFIKRQIIRSLVRWVFIPIAVLQVFGWLDDVTAYLDTLDVNIGNIRISVYGLIRVIIFGFILFWLGRISNQAGQRIIRNQTDLHVGTREVFAKLFEVTLFIIIFILLLQVMGINLTALAVFGGALGVGLGFGLQSIASNFISGIIILLDRSVTIGDYVEIEDGTAGIVREMNMRCTVLETFDGKDIVVPNEKFITDNVINWTHKDEKQRYTLNFQVAYKTDLDKLFEIVREVCRNHPKVLSGPDYPFEEQPDAEIQSFDDFGITILVEFWMMGIDDGKNRVAA
ncbi:MAG: mechanosensitive ion channel, partial [Thiotrichales bacterium]|nr:mechanosensitive ion channel [Thiotrichales bacterium]